MKVSDERIDEFIELWERAFGERITRGEAVSKARQLIELYRVMSQELPVNRDDHEPPEPPPAEGR
jgi:hypothetical protein